MNNRNADKTNSLTAWINAHAETVGLLAALIAGQLAWNLGNGLAYTDRFANAAQAFALATAPFLVQGAFAAATAALAWWGAKAWATKARAAKAPEANVIHDEPLLRLEPTPRLVVEFWPGIAQATISSQGPRHEGYVDLVQQRGLKARTRMDIIASTHLPRLRQRVRSAWDLLRSGHQQIVIRVQEDDYWGANRLLHEFKWIPEGQEASRRPRRSFTVESASREA
jgi:hypothetical protein